VEETFLTKCADASATVAAASGPVLCPVCGSGNYLEHYANRLSGCQSCRHKFQTDLAISARYDASYAHQYDDRPHRAMSELRWNFIQRTLNFGAGRRVLDIGYGNGSFLKHCESRGAEIFGIDVHGEDFGIPEVNFRTNLEFDLICFFDSLEHLPSFDIIMGLKAKYVIVSVPNPPNFFLAEPGRWRHFKPGEHLHYFSRDSLDYLMREWLGGRKISEGYPEDALRGKLSYSGVVYDNIYTAIYAGYRAA
jgi:SAM-dependent methyltransferase